MEIKKGLPSGSGCKRVDSSEVVGVHLPHLTCEVAMQISRSPAIALGFRCARRPVLTSVWGRADD